MSTRRALVFSFLDRYAALVLSIASSMIIARLLTPADIGIFSVTMVLVAFANSLRDLGAGQFLVQTRELTVERVRATWSVLLGTGLLMACVVLLAAYPVAAFYREPRMAWIMAVVALSFVFNPFGSMTYAWLMREMRFEKLALMRLFSSLAGAVTSALLAWLDYGPMSLALGNLAATAVNAGVGAWYRPAHFGWRPGLGGLRQVLKFGGTTSGTNLLWDFANGAPELLLGRLQSLAAAGYYSRANGLTMMFHRLVLDATHSVALPMFSREHRTSGNISVSFLRATSYVTALGWTFFMGLMLLAHPATRVLYGDQWDASVELVRMLALGMCISMPAVMCIPALLAVGKVLSILRLTLILVPVQAGAVAAGAYFSVFGAAAGFAAAQIVAVLLWLSVAQREIEFGWPAFFATLGRSAGLAALVTSVPLICLAALMNYPTGHLLPLVVAAVGGTGAFVFLAGWMRHPIGEELQRVLSRLPWRR